MSTDAEIFERAATDIRDLLPDGWTTKVNVTTKGATVYFKWDSPISGDAARFAALGNLLMEAPERYLSSVEIAWGRTEALMAALAEIARLAGTTHAEEIASACVSRDHELWDMLRHVAGEAVSGRGPR